VATAAAAAALVALAVLPLAGRAWPWAAGVAAALAVTSTAIDGGFLLFAARRVSAGFAGACVVFQLLHRAVAALGLLVGYAWPGPAPRRAPPRP
jgi:hypothetical protein